MEFWFFHARFQTNDKQINVPVVSSIFVSLLSDLSQIKSFKHDIFNTIQQDPIQISREQENLN